MTPSHSPSAHALSRNNPCPLPYDRPKQTGFLRRLLERAEPTPRRINGHRKAEFTAVGPMAGGAKNGIANTEVTEFLLGKVVELWRDERGEGQQRDLEATSKVTSVDRRVTDGTRIETIQSKPTASQPAEKELATTPLWKRVLDLTLIILSSPIWLPVMLVLMLAVRLSSPGPIFYRQERVGHHRRRFMIYKFRSMKVDAETHVHEVHFERLMRESVPMVKLDGKGDPRILPWGRLMRATGLDELPQIFNVIRGEMSLVGPRPCTVHEFARYAPWQQERVNAVPGLTGYWQVNGKNRTTFNEMIDMDIFYSKHLSLVLDLTILLQTVPALLEQTFESFASRTLNRSSYPPSANTSEGI